MSGFMKRKYYTEMFGKKEDSKPTEKPAPGLFSGLSMKKNQKIEAPVSTGYMPPVTEVLQSKPELFSYKPPDMDSLKTAYLTKPTAESSSIDSAENSKSQEDPFSNIKLADDKKPKRNAIPGFGDDDEDSDNLEFVKKSKLNILQNKDSPLGINKEGEKKIDGPANLEIQFENT